MSLRQWLNDNASLGITAATGLLVVAVAVIFWQSGGAGPQVQQDEYFLDLDTGRVFAAPRRDPPVTPPQGNEGRGVAASIYACGECPEVDFSGLTPEEIEAEGAFLQYVETFEDWAVEIIERYEEAGEPRTPEEEEEYFRAMAEGRVVAPAHAMDQWVPEVSDRAEMIMLETLEERCPGPEPPRPCAP